MTKRRIRNVGGVEIPSATTTKVFSCGDPNCGHAHLVAYDENEKPFAEIVVNLDIAIKALDIIFVVKP